MAAWQGSALINSQMKRKRIVIVSCLLLCLFGFAVCLLTSHPPNGPPAVHLHFIDHFFTNGIHYARMQMANQGKRLLVYHGAYHGGLKLRAPDFIVSIPIQNGWTNIISNRAATRSLLFLEPKSTNLTVIQVPQYAKQWKVGIDVFAPSRRERVLHFFLKRPGILRYVPLKLWQLFSGSRGQSFEVWSEVFTNAPSAYP
jgi:hypothetical protein